MERGKSERRGVAKREHRESVGMGEERRRERSKVRDRKNGG